MVCTGILKVASSEVQQTDIEQLQPLLLQQYHG